MSTNPYLSMRQRRLPPIDRYHGRLGPSTGGVDVAHPATLAPGIVNTVTRDIGDANDSQIVRDRMPFYEYPRFIPPGNGWVDWTRAGPIRASLHMRQHSFMIAQGTSNDRFPVNPDSPTGGYHTSTPSTVARTVPRYVSGNPQMVPGRVDLLAPGQYSGQTYSQTTRVLGR